MLRRKNLFLIHLYIYIYIYIGVSFISCIQDLNNEEQKGIDNIETISYGSLDIVSYTSGITFPLYEEEKVDSIFCKLKIKKKGNYLFQWYRKSGNDANYEPYGNADLKTLETNDEYISSCEVKKCNYLNESFYLKIIKDNSEVDAITTPEVSILQILDTGIPTLYINTVGGVDVISKEEWLDAHLRITSSEADFSVKTKIKGRGNTSWLTEKKPYSLKLESKQELLGMKSSKRWVLINNHVDKSLLRNVLASYIGNNIFNSYWNPSFKSVDLVLNGEYKGTYLLGESIKIDKNRVNIQSLEDTYIGKGIDLNEDGVVNKNDGGFIIEKTRKLDEWQFSTNKGLNPISLKDPETEDFSEWNGELKNYIIDTVRTAEDSLYCDVWKDKENGYAKYFDVNSIIDWYLISDFLKSADSNFNCSVFFYYNPSDKKLYFGPNWDFDDCCGNYIGYGDNLASPMYFYIYGNVGWINRLFEDEEFVQLLKKRWNEKKELLNEVIICKLQNWADEISASAKNNFKRYEILGNVVFPSYSPVGYEDRVTYQSEVDFLIDWCKRRYVWFDTAINEF